MTVLHLPSHPGQLVMDPEAPPNGRRVYVCEPFRFFFALDGGKAAPADATDSDGDGVPDYVAVMLQKLITAYDVYINVIRLPDFCQTGYLHQQGLRYVDVLLDDIPSQRGLMSSTLSETAPEFLRDSKYAGPSVVLRLHRALPKSTLTPAHELFHLFQYASLPFLNMWFMEGLARHGQRWMDDKRPQTAPLPQTQHGLEDLLQQWHEAEWFWNRLGELCNQDAPQHAFGLLIKPEVAANPFLVGQRFLECFFRHARLQLPALCAEMPGRKLTEYNPWPAVERRSGANNRFLLRAVCATLVELLPTSQPEVSSFTAVVNAMDRQRVIHSGSQEVQIFFGTLKRLGLAEVRTAPDGNMQCDAYDAASATLSLPEIACAAGQLTDEDIDSFTVVRHIIGKLYLKDQSRLTRLDGLASLLAIEGNLSIERTGIQSLSRLLPALRRIKGYLHILDNPQLQTLTGFDSLASIDDELVISGNPELIKVSAFGQLKEIKKGELILRQSPRLELIQGFNNLQSVRGLHLEQLAIRQIDFLKKLFTEKQNFPGAIRIVYCRLEHIRALEGLRTVASSFYLHGNLITELYPLHQLTRVGASFSLSSNRIQYLHALKNLTEVNGMLGLMNNRLQSLDGLENLQSLKTVKWNNELRTLALKNNPSLSNLEALKNVLVHEPLVIDVNLWESYDLPIGGVPFYSNSILVKPTGEGLAPVSVLCSIKTQSMTRNLKKKQNFNVYSVEFVDVDEILGICHKKQLDVLFATTLSAIRFVHKNDATLRSAGLRYLVPSAKVLKSLVNKDTFYTFMESHAFKEYIPKVYRTLTEMKFPCIKKSKSDSGGKGQFKVDSESKVSDDFSDFIYSEYISGSLEYAANVLVVGGKIVYAQNFEKYTSEYFYILGIGDQAYSKVKSRPVAMEFSDVFEKILRALGCEGFYCIDYKKIDNIPKIFEINARIGLTNGSFPALLERSIRAYCSELD